MLNNIGSVLHLIIIAIIIRAMKCPTLLRSILFTLFMRKFRNMLMCVQKCSNVPKKQKNALTKGDIAGFLVHFCTFGVCLRFF